MRRAIFFVFAFAAFAAGCASRSSSPLVPEAASLGQLHFGATLHPNLSDGQRVKAAIAEALAALPSPTAPGIAIALNYHGKAFYYYQGVQKLDGRAVDGNTIFEMGSVTKSFTGIL